MIGNQEYPGLLLQTLNFFFKFQEYLSNSQQELGSQYRKLFETIKLNSLAQKLIGFELYFECFEIYNEILYDLLSKNKEHLVLKEINKKYVVKDLETIHLEFSDNIYNELLQIFETRSSTSTNLNTKSSRSHMIFNIYVQSQFSNGERTNIKNINKICLVDLAGSERNKRTDNAGQLLYESCNINRSLLNLGRCIIAINNKEQVIPFRESKLTKILSEYFLDNSSIKMVVNINPVKEDFNETLRALQYGAIAKEIVFQKAKTPTRMQLFNTPQQISKMLFYSQNEIADYQQKQFELQEQNQKIEIQQKAIEDLKKELINLKDQYVGHIKKGIEMQFKQAYSKIQKLEEERTKSQTDVQQMFNNKQEIQKISILDLENPQNLNKINITNEQQIWLIPKNQPIMINQYQQTNFSEEKKNISIQCTAFKSLEEQQKNTENKNTSILAQSIQAYEQFYDCKDSREKEKQNQTQITTIKEEEIKNFQKSTDLMCIKNENVRDKKVNKENRFAQKHQSKCIKKTSKCLQKTNKFQTKIGKRAQIMEDQEQQPQIQKLKKNLDGTKEISTIKFCIVLILNIVILENHFINYTPIANRLRNKKCFN